MSVRDDTRPGPAPGAPAPVRARPDGAPPPRPRSGGRLLPPWSRAPLLPFGQPAVLLAVVAAAAILACAAASAPLFLSSAASAALQRLSAESCPEASTAAVKQRAPATELAALDRRVVPALTGAGLAAPRLTAYPAGVTSVGAPEPLTTFGGPTPFRLVYRADALANVTRLPGAVGGRGVWLSEYAADRLGVRPGTTVRVGDRPVRLAGYYANLYDGPLPPYWCSYRQDVAGGGSDVPPQLVLATDPGLFTALSGPVPVDFSWVSAVDADGLTVTRGHVVRDRQRAAYAAAGLPEPRDVGRITGGAGVLPVLTDRAVLIRDGLRGPVLPIALGGTLLALLLVGAAGSYWADRRFAEVRLLSARGVGPAALAGKAVLELALPAAVGSALGWLVAGRLVTWLGPSPSLDPAAPRQAGLVAVAGLLAGLALLGLVAGLRSRAATERPVGARRSRLAAVPWELVLLAAAALTYARLRSGAAVTVVQNVAQVHLLVVLFPLLFVLGGSVLVVRLLTLLLPVLARRAGRLSAAWYLAVRRLTANRAATVLLLAAAATPVATSVYAAGLTTGSEQTLVAKARTFTGAEVAVLANEPLPPTPAGTVVVRYLYARVGGTDVAVLAVDRATFAGTAYWRPGWADRSLPDLLAALDRPAADGRVPALVVDPRRELAAGPLEVGLGASRLPVSRAATADLFPGRRLPVPMIVVDRARLPALDPHAGTRYELWTRGPAAPAQAAVLAADARVFDTVDRARIFRAADYLGITWTFGYLTALAGLVGLVSVGALLLYVETRQRSRVASYALGRRMGLGRAVHLRSLLAELGLLLGVAYAVGVGLGWLALDLVHGLLDVDPSRPPGPLLVLPLGVLAGAAAAVVLVTVLTALNAQRVADRTPPAQVLRLGS